MLAARPAGVCLSLIRSGMTFREKIMVSWVGLRGAVPIILATFPLLAGIPKADVIFNIVFFIVLTSALLQGATISRVARWLGVDAPISAEPAYPIECEPTGKMKCDMAEVQVPDNSIVSNKRILELDLPDGALVMLIKRNDGFIVPGGGTVINEGDSLLVLADKDTFNKVRSIVRTQAVKPE